MEKPLITVIVPVYKVENTLEKCVESIKNQTYKNLEIILVDDGSPDRSGEMCDEFAKADDRIRVIHKANGGQSSARNVGLDSMNGEYVCFVDSDDWIEENMYEKLYSLIIDNEADIACCGIIKEYGNGKIERFDPYYNETDGVKVYTKFEALKESLRNCKITYSLWDKLYDKKIFDSLRMTVGKIYEDMEIIPKCIEKAERIVYTPELLYHYNQIGESTIRCEFNIRRFAEADVAKEKAEDYKERYPELYIQALAQYIAISLNIIHKSKGVKECEVRRKELIKIIKSKQPNGVQEFMRRNDRIKYRVFKFCPFLYEILMKIYDKRKDG